MEYSIKKFSKMAGVTSRTLRYYDEIGILKPSRVNSSGYRIYGEKEVDLLQQILFYRELGVDLNSIKNIVYSPNFDEKNALRLHHEQLMKKREELNKIIANVEKTIQYKEGRIDMSDNEKFEGFKDKLIMDNEDKYGKEVREKYGDKAIEASNAKVKSMNQSEYNDVTDLGEEILKALSKAFSTGDPSGDLGQKVAEMHRKWLGYYWDFYSEEAHAGLAQMYVDDERFTKFYDKEQPGSAKFLRDAIFIYTGKEI